MSVKLTSTKSHENPCDGSQVVTWSVTEMAKMFGVFSESFIVNAPKITNMAMEGIIRVVPDIFKVAENYTDLSYARKKRIIKF